MKAPNLHLNLLHASERQSSSPVRLRVMLPILAALACAGCLVWWGVLFCQKGLVKAQIDSKKREIAAKQPEYEGVRHQLVEKYCMEAELDQLTMYANGRRTYGAFFDNLAKDETMPVDVELMELKIPEPGPQNLLPPGAKPGQKGVPQLLGPTGTVENVTLVIRGRTLRKTNVKQSVGALTKALEGPAFANTLVERKPITWTEMNGPASDGGDRLPFRIEYRCAERRFEK